MDVWPYAEPVPQGTGSVRERISARLHPPGARPVPPWTSPGELVRSGFTLLIGLPLIVAMVVGGDTSVGALVAQSAALVAALGLLRLRRSYPVLVSSVLILGSTVFPVVFGAMLIALVSLATGRRWSRIIAVGVLFVAGTLGIDALQEESVTWWAGGALTLAVYGTCVGFGAYIGSRRDLEDALRERAHAAEQEQAARVREAQVAERTRIAREMHDVLAHRISLVAMHAGVLAFRPDLAPDDRTATAEVIRDNANRALSELRQVLGVLRADAPTGDAEPPQPHLDRLDDLIAEAEAAGSPVRAVVDPSTREALSLLPGALSRNAYRIAQEALTNARKHAPGAPIRVEVSGAPGGLLTLVVHNPAGHRPPSGLTGSGTGLIGVGERVRLLHGNLDHGPDGAGGYRLTAILPWPENDHEETE